MPSEKNANFLQQYSEVSVVSQSCDSISNFVISGDGNPVYISLPFITFR
jgi:hypothetical protein